jgi:hypothetical protein
LWNDLDEVFNCHVVSRGFADLRRWPVCQPANSEDNVIAQDLAADVEEEPCRRIQQLNRLLIRAVEYLKLIPFSVQEQDFPTKLVMDFT